MSNNSNQDYYDEVGKVWDETTRQTQLLKFARQFHPEELAFHKTVTEAKDFTPHLIYADWLEEHGKPATAKFIRRWVQYRDTNEDKPFNSTDTKVPKWYAYAPEGHKVVMYPTYERPKLRNILIAIPTNSYSWDGASPSHIIYNMNLPKNEATQLHSELQEEYNNGHQ